MKNLVFCSICFVLISVFFRCGPGTSSDTLGAKEETFSLDFSAIADKLMERMDLQPGEKVLLVIAPGRFNELIPHLKSGIERKKAIYLGTISVLEDQPEEWTTSFTIRTKDLPDEELRDYLKEMDLGVMLPGATPNDKVYKLIQDNLNEGIGRTIHFHWEGAYGLNGMVNDIDEQIDRFYQKSLHETDYEALKATQIEFEEAMRGATIRVTTPAGTDISFEIGDRPVTKQDGNASKATTDLGRNLIDREIELPAGAIRVAPVEETVNGIIVFPDGQWNSEPVKGLSLKIIDGKVVLIDVEEGLENAKAEISGAGEAGRSFREFALGMNPTLAIPENEPWIPYYGYGAGVVRLSLGNNLELGGKVGGNYVRWNFFTDATVRVGDDVWVENGKLIR